MKKVWIILAVIVCLFLVFLAVLAYNGILHEDTDFSNYLEAGSDFNSAASVFLPGRDFFTNAQISDYVHGRYNNGTEYLYFTVQYSQAQYTEAKMFAENRMELAWEEYASFGYGESFSLNNHKFLCCTVRIDKDYAYAYYASDETHTITYLFLTDSQLEFMSVVDYMESYKK